VLLAAGASWLLSDQLGFSPAQVILTVGVLSLLATYIQPVVPDFLIRFLLWLFTHTPAPHRRRRAAGPFRGRHCWYAITFPVMDGLLVGACAALRTVPGL
jgi:hypothetical protein